jgi:hypothetical protein
MEDRIGRIKEHVLNSFLSIKHLACFYYYFWVTNYKAPRIQKSYCHSYEFLLFIFNRPQRAKYSLLALRQSFHLRNIHPFIGSVTPQCTQTNTKLVTPEVNCSIITATGKGLATGTEGYRKDPMAMALQSVEALTTAYLPQAYCLVITAAGKELTIKTKSHRGDQVAMVVESVETLTTINVPQAHRLVFTATSKRLPIRAKGHRSDPASMALQGVKASTATHLP